MAKKIIAIVLVIVTLCVSIPSAFALTSEADERDIHVMVYGLDQPYANRIWAVSDIGKVSYIQIWTREDGHMRCLKNYETMKPNQQYQLKIEVCGVVGDVYINGYEHTRAKSYGDLGTEDCYAVGEYDYISLNFSRTASEPPTYVSLWGFNQLNPNLIYATTSFGKVVMTNIYDNGRLVNKNTFLKPNHIYEVKIRIADTTGQMYINGVRCTTNQFWGDERFVEGSYIFKTPSLFPCFGYMWCCPFFW